MELSNYIIDQALILIPVLFVLGKFLKTSNIKDNLIPTILLVIGVVLSMLMIGFTVDGFIQGVLVAGTAVFTNEMIKQSTRDKELDK